MEIRFRRGCAAVLVIVCLTLAGCAKSSPVAEPSDPDPAEVQPIAGTDLSRVVLTAEAESTLGIATDTVRADATRTAGGSSSAAKTSVPMGAVIYDPTGLSWVYTSTAARTYERAQIAIAQTTSQTAYLSSGPPVGMTIVTTGASELLGAEYGVGGE